MRQGASDADLSEAIGTQWSGRTDRFSDERWKHLQSGNPYKPESHKKIEMITLGGLTCRHASSHSAASCFVRMLQTFGTYSGHPPCGTGSMGEIRTSQLPYGCRDIR